MFDALPARRAHRFTVHAHLAGRLVLSLIVVVPISVFLSLCAVSDYWVWHFEWMLDGSVEIRMRAATFRQGNRDLSKTQDVCLMNGTLNLIQFLQLDTNTEWLCFRGVSDSSIKSVPGLR